MLLKNGQRTKVDAEGWAGGRRESRDILSRINLIPLGGVNMFLISGLRQIIGVYISIIKFNLAGNEKLIELRYEMDITSFKMLFRLQIDSS